MSATHEKRIQAPCLAPSFMKMIQTHLVNDQDHMITWLPRDSRVKVGSRISLKHDDDIWTVKDQFCEADMIDINQARDWQVGGVIGGGDIARRR